MACRNCRWQLALLTRQATTITETQNVATLRQLVAVAAGPPHFDQRRNFGSTTRQSGFRDTVSRILKNTVAQPYLVVSATEGLYKAAAREAAYTIPDEDRKAGTIRKTEEGEDIGEGNTMWHEVFKLPPTFSTWSQVTMLHMYLLFARLRDLDQESARSWQRQLVDHYFFDAEAKMDLVHGISSRTMRHTYLKDLFIQWRGVIAAYDEGVIKGDSVLAAAVWRNVFKAREDMDMRALAAVVSWMRRCLCLLDQVSDEILLTQSPHVLHQAIFRWSAKGELPGVDAPVKELEGVVGAESRGRDLKVDI
ncbi:ubiquinol-cytochrome C chaperone-domain-containing protein [Jackrogersella minutella]|nr:ubiquinol-cytochrome C chaperone-domain-containing protein [Jackrogersella minutella]